MRMREWGVSKEVRPGSARTAQISVSREIRNFAKSFPACPAIMDHLRWERGKVDTMRRMWGDQCVTCVSYLHYVLMNDIRVICVPVVAAWWSVTFWHSLLSALICHPISHWVIPSLDTDPDASPVCFVTLSANQRPVLGWADQSEARVSVFSSVLGPGARIMTKLFEQFSGVMSIMLILSAGHLLSILTQCVANNNFITIS